jgi:hypothetical protein
MKRNCESARFFQEIMLLIVLVEAVKAASAESWNRINRDCDASRRIVSSRAVRRSRAITSLSLLETEASCCDRLLANYNQPSPAPVAQLDRASASGAEGCAFEPRRAHFPVGEK